MQRTMKKIIEINTVDDYNKLVGHETLHPLVSMIDFSNYGKRKYSNAAFLNFGCYTVFYKNNKYCDLKYGRNTYDYREGTLVFIAPWQVVGIERNSDNYKPSGYALLFHPDLLKGTSLSHNMKDYSFFSYEVHEGLHLSEKEKEVVLECFRKIDYELTHRN
jgi:AraC family transcriptional activator of pobA